MKVALNTVSQSGQSLNGTCVVFVIWLWLVAEFGVLLVKNYLLYTKLKWFVFQLTSARLRWAAKPLKLLRMRCLVSWWCARFMGPKSHWREPALLAVFTWLYRLLFSLKHSQNWVLRYSNNVFCSIYLICKLLNGVFFFSFMPVWLALTRKKPRANYKQQQADTACISYSKTSQFDLWQWSCCILLERFVAGTALCLELVVMSEFASYADSFSKKSLPFSGGFV